MLRTPNQQSTSNGKLSRGRRASLLKAAILGALALTPAVASADLTWDADGAGAGTGGPGTWDTTALRWFDGATHVAWPVNGDAVAIFDTTTTPTPTVSLGVNIKANVVQFNVDGYTIAPTAAETLELVAGTAFPSSGVISVATGATATINANMTTAALVDWQKAGDGTLVLGGTNTFGGAIDIGGGVLKFGNVAAVNAASINVAAGTLEYSGATLGTIANPVSFGAGIVSVSNAAGELELQSVQSDLGSTMTKQGAGILTLSAANASHNGDTVVAAGTLRITNSLALQNSPLDLAGGAVNFGTVATPLTAATVGGLKGAGNLALTNPAAGNVDLTINNAVDATYTGALSGGGTLTKENTGIQTLSAASTRTGTTQINGGRLAVTNLTAAGTGAVTVNGANSVYEINTAAGTLAQDVTLNNGGTFQWTQNAQLTQTPKTLNFTGTGGTIFVGGSGSSGKVLSAAGLVTSTAGSVMTKTGGGVFQLAGANPNFLGDVSLQAGTLEFQNVDSLGTTVKTVTISGTGDLATSGTTNRNNIILDGGTISANSTAAIYSGTITVNSASTIALRQFQTLANGNSFAISGPISGAGALNITSSTDNDAATLTLSGNNTGYSGTMTIGQNVTVAAVTTQSLGTSPITLNSGGLAIRGANTTSVTAGSGLQAVYYNFGFDPDVDANLGNATRTEFANLLVTLAPRAFSRVDSQINMPNGGSGSYPVVPVPNWSFNVNDGAMWKGLINITTAGSYQFNAQNDDGAQLFIDGVQIGGVGVNATGGNMGTAQTLSAGYHSIVYKFGQGGGGGYTVLRYSGPDSSNTMVTIPASAFAQYGAATAIPDLTVNGTASLEASVPTVTPTASFNSGSTLNLTSIGIEDLTISGATTLNGGLSTINTNTAGIVFNGPIGESAYSDLTLGGGYRKTFNAINTYAGLTKVTGGQLVLNATGGNSIPGNLEIDAPNNASQVGPVTNVKLLQSNQIADTATLTLTQGILDLGANSETVNGLNLNGGRIIGTGSLSISTASFNVQTIGAIEVPLAGTGGFSSYGAGVLTLTGTNTLAGPITVSNGTLRVAGGTLGAGGAGNETTISFGQLQLSNSLNPTEIVSSQVDAGVRATFGTSSVGSLDYPYSVAPVLRVDDGAELIIGSALTSPSGTIAKEGAGTLTFAYNVGASLPANVTHNAGVLGFSGPQSFGAPTIPAGKAFKFNSDPGVGVTGVIAPAGTTVIAGFAAANQLLPRIDGSSAGTLALAVDSSANLDFTADPSLSLGAIGSRVYSGTITPGATGYRLGGGGGTLRVTNPLTGTADLTVGGGRVEFGNVVNTFTGGVIVNNGGTLRVQNDPNLGNPANSITLDNGTLELTQNVHSNGQLGAIAGQLGNQLHGGPRNITIGAGGGTISTPSWAAQSNSFIVSGAISGSGTLTKTGYGSLYLFGNSPSFTGNLVLSSPGGLMEMRGAGAMPNVASISIGQSFLLVVDNANGLGSRQYGSAYVADRVNNAAPISLTGGELRFRARNAAGNIAETIGATTLGEGHSRLRVEHNGQGAELTISNLVRNLGGGTVYLENGGGTFGATGNNPRMFLTQINGVAAATTNLIGGWAMLNNNGVLDWAAYDTTAGVGVKTSTYTAVGAVAFTPTNTQVVNLNAAATATLADSATNQHQVLALRFDNNAAQTLAFADANDTLYVVSGGILDRNYNQTRAIGTTALRGSLTAGPVGATTPQDLFLHINQNTTTVESQIIDNPGLDGSIGGGDDQPVTLISDIGGTILLNTANTYSGGTKLYRGRINVATAGGLGSGSVLVKAAQLELRASGAIADFNYPPSKSITGRDGSEIYLQAATAYTSYGDRFIIEAGSTIGGASNASGTGLGSLTRVDLDTFNNLNMSVPAAGGQIVLHPDAIVRSTNAVNGDVMTNLPANLGANADLYYNQSGGGGASQYITIGVGTPWKGISSSVGDGWRQGTIYANSDFYLQGLQRVGAIVALQLGQDNNSSYAIINRAGKPINAYVTGQVALQENSPVIMPGDLTFVVTKDGLLQPNYTNSFGFAASVADRAKVLVQAGGTLDPGGFVGVGAAANQAFGVPYPVPSPINTNVTVEAGGRMLINDASGIGSTTGGAVWLMKSDSIMQLNNGNAFLGSNAGLINAGQFVYEPGVIVRLEGNRIWKLEQFVSAEPNGDKVVWEIFNGNRQITEAVNPFIAPAVGAQQVFPLTLPIASGQIVTNDTNDRSIDERRGKITLADGAILAGTTQTYLNIQENVEVPAGATVQIGSTKWIDGMPKLGAVQFTGPASNVFGAGVTVNVNDGAQFGLNNVHTFPDNGNIHLPAAVTAYPAAGGVSPQPGSGSTLLQNTANYLEVIGMLTGNGAVIANNGVDNTGTAVGWGATSDFTFDGVFKGNFAFTNRNPGLVKVGPTRMTLTNTHDTTTLLTVYQGELVLAGPNGKWGAPTNAATEMRIAKGGTLIFDNTVNAVADRQVTTGGGNDWLTTLGGGEFKLLGHATDVADVTMFGIANSAGNGGFGLQGGNTGGAGKITVIPSGDLTTLRTSVTFSTAENFQTTGDRNSVWLIRGVGMGGLPGTYDASGAYTPNPANPKDGLVFITTPNMTVGTVFSANGNANGLLPGGPGTPVAAVLPHILVSANPTATEGDFATIDVASGTSRTGVRALQASEYASSSTQNANLTQNVRVPASTALNFTGGDSRFAVLKLENGSSLNISGVLPNLTQKAQVFVNSGGILVPSGATASITSTGGAPLRMGGGTSAYLHAYGDLNISAPLFTDIRVVKAGPGTVTFAAGAAKEFRGGLVVHEGVVNLNDSLSNIRAGVVTDWSFYGPYVELNGGTINLNGKSQFFRRLESATILPGAATEGGTITSATPATLSTGQAAMFSGHITGAITFDKLDTATMVLTNTNTYTGNTIIRQGQLILRDSATLSGTPQVDINYARLDIDDGYLSYVQDRVNPAAVINMKGADLVIRGRAGTLTQQHFDTVNLLTGMTRFQTLAGGGGATETIIDKLTRVPGTVATFNQNYGFVGTPGNDTTAIRYLINQVGGQPIANVVTANNGILGGWAIINGNDFATYLPGRGLGAMGNTEDGFRAYSSGDLSTAGPTDNVNDGTARTINTKTVNSLRFNGNVTFTINAGQTLTVASGGILANRDNAHGFSGGSITSGTNELVLFVNNNTMTIGSQITGAIALTKTGNATVTLTGNNNYTGATYVGVGGSTTGNDRAGTLNLNTTGANGVTTFAIPGDLHVYNSTVTELQANQIKRTANIYLYAGADLQLRDADNLFETLSSINFRDIGGNAQNFARVGRAAARPTSTLELTGATPISSDNTNPQTTPGFHGQVGQLLFTSTAPTGATLQIDGPVTRNGLSAAGLFLDPVISGVPAGIDDGGLVKKGTGMLVIRGANTFGSPGSPTEVFNIAEGFVRLDGASSVLGTPNAITTVQNGAKLLLNGTSATGGSLQMKDGSTLGVTINAGTIGAVGTTATLDVPAGATTTVEVRDYFIENTNNGNIFVNNKLTGAGTINLVGTDFAAGYNGGGLFQLRNTANDFSGIINVGTNTVLENNSNTSNTGKALGTATVNLNGGTLRIRDDGDNTATAQTLAFDNNVNLNASSMLDFERVGTVAANKTFTFGTLNVAAGTQVLNTPYGTGATIWGNSYRAAFTEVTGPGNLTYGGTRFVDLNGYNASFSGNIEVAGPQGLGLTRSGGLTLNAATNAINNLTVGGFHTMAAAKVVNVANTLDVTQNTGAVANGFAGISTGEITGVLLAQTGSTVNANTVKNNGIIAANGGAATITADDGNGDATADGTGGFVGSGLYLAYNQSLTLNGPVKNDGATPTKLRVAGTGANAIVLTNSAALAVNNTYTGGTEIQSGTLRVNAQAASASPLGTGAIKVFGAPATAAGSYSQPIAAQAGVLVFDTGAGNAVTQATAITNNGTVRVSGTGSVTTGPIGGTVVSNLSNLADFNAATVPGLLEGYISGGFDATSARVANPGNSGIKLEPRMMQDAVVTQNPITGWTDNNVWVYTGYFYDADGVFTFIENLDDNMLVSIDGVNRIQNGGSQITSTAIKSGIRGAAIGATDNAANQGDLITATTPLAANPNLPAGWHTIEIRGHNGGGGAGPWGVTNGFTLNYGFGFNPNGTMALDGTQYLRPIDPGDGTLFRTANFGKGNVEVGAGGTLNTPSITNTATLTMGAGATPSVTNLGNGASAIDNIVVTGSTGSAKITTSGTASLTVGNVTTSATLEHNGAANRLVITGNATGGTINSTGTAGVTFDSNSDQSATSAIAGNGGLIKQGTGILTVVNNNTYSGATQITGGTLRLDNSTLIAGLNEGRVTGAFNTTTPNPNTSVQNTTRYANIVDSETGGYPATGGAWVNNSTYVYTGYINNPTAGNVTWTFAENFDDSVLLVIDGVPYLNDPTWNSPTKSNVTLSPGRHSFELRLGQGGGGVGPANAGWLNDLTKGFVYDPTGADTTNPANYIVLTDPGDGSLFSTNFVASGNLLPSTTPVSISAGATLDLNGRNQTIGSLAGAGSVTLGTGTLTTGTDNTSTAFSGDISGSGGLTKVGNGIQTLSGTNTYGGETRIGGGVLRTATVASLPAGGIVVINSGALAQAGGATPATTLADVVNEVKTSRNNGAWTNTGRYRSEAAAADTLKITGLGVILNNDGGVTPIQPAISTDPTDVLVKYTYNGDSDLDGVVDADDYFLIDRGFIAAGARTGWYNGDYNYDGKIDIDDYFMIDVAYARQSGPLSGGDLAPIAPVAPSAPSAAVPEPGTLSLLALGAAALLGRRRRSK